MLIWAADPDQGIVCDFKAKTIILTSLRCNRGPPTPRYLVKMVHHKPFQSQCHKHTSTQAHKHKHTSTTSVSQAQAHWVSQAQTQPGCHKHTSTQTQAHKHNLSVTSTQTPAQAHWVSQAQAHKQAQAQKHKHNKHTNLSVTSTLSHLANIWLFCGWFVRAGTFWIMESKLAKHCQSTIVLGKGFFRRKTNVVCCHQCWNWFHNTIVLAKGFFRRKNCHRCWIVRGRSAAECSRWSCDTTSCEHSLYFGIQMQILL